MANRVKEIFAKKDTLDKGSINFKDTESRKKFIEALNRVWEKGEAVEVEGIDSVDRNVVTDIEQYQVDHHENISKFVIAPNIEIVSHIVDTEYGKKEIIFQRIKQKEKTVLHTEEDSVVFLKVVLDKTSSKSEISCNIQPKKATKTFEIIESCTVCLAFLNELHSNEKDNINENNEKIVDFKKYLVETIKFYKKILFVEKTFEIEIKPSDLFEDTTSEIDLYELYVLLNDHQTLRLDSKIHDFERDVTLSENVLNDPDFNKKVVGNFVELPYVDKKEYKLWSKKVTLYCACLLSNTMVKEIKYLDGNEARIVLTDTDSNPMYITYQGFLTKNDAIKERDNILKKISEYKNAPTLRDYLNCNKE